MGQPGCAPVFAAKDRQRIPSHWSRFEGRRSVLASANGNRKAERVLNAILNYTYALLEAEAILACQVVGLDSGLGIVHADTRNRQSLALDLMEPVRPLVDAFALDLLERRTFRKVEFTETADGHCRLRAPLTHDLAETMPTWARAVAPVAEHVAHVLGQAMAGKYSQATPLTGRRTRSAQVAVKARKAAVQRAAKSTTVRQRPTGQTATAAWSCPDCGARVANHRHVRCDACIAADPQQTNELRGRRGAAIASRKRALKEWETAHPGAVYDPDYFSRDLLPKLKEVKLVEIAKAASCSKAYASDIRSGKYTPHLSTWQALGALVGLDPSWPMPR